MLYRSIVKIYTTSLVPSYSEPWRGSRTAQLTGSGFILDYLDKTYLITNAHVVNRSTFIQVKLADADYPNKYEAKLITIGRDCDLAILEVSDPKFQETVVSIQLSSAKVKTGDKVKTIGFPIGGEECCQTDGVISRSGWAPYSFSRTMLLTTSIDAKISPGNSGGPVLNQENQVIGVVHQGNPDGKTLGQMIPVEIVKHFLDDARTNKQYAGFPQLGISTQPIENPSLRAHLGMKENQTGLLVTKIPQLSATHGLFEPQDVLLSVDDTIINNVGKVSLKSDFDTPVDFRCIFQRHHLGDVVHFKVLRNKQEINLEIKLDHTFISKNGLVPFILDEITPAYIEHSGVILQTLSDNYACTFYDESTGSTKPPQTLLPYLNQVNLFKNKTTQQIVFIRLILQDAETQGYDYFNHQIVQEINGRKISNLWDAWHALDSNLKDVHIIITKDENLLVIKNLPPPINDVLRQRYQIAAQTAPKFVESQKWTLFMTNVLRYQKEERLQKAKIELAKLRSNQLHQDDSDVYDDAESALVKRKRSTPPNETIELHSGPSP